MTFVRTAFGKLNWWQKVLLLSLLSVLYIHLCAWVGVKLLVPAIGWDVGVLDLSNDAGRFEGWLARWDSSHYLRIAQNGYRPGGLERAFFPLYPLIVRGLHYLAGISFLWSGLIISTVSYLGICLLLYRWILLDHPEKDALWAVGWICISPMSFFLVNFYSEALFILLCLAGFYFARKGRFLASGLAISLAGATRAPAFLLAIPYILEFLQQHDYHSNRVIHFILGALVAPLGMLGFLFYLSSQTGNANIFAVHTYVLASEFQRSFTWPWLTLYDGLRGALLGKSIPSGWFARITNLHELAYALLGITTSIWALFRLRLSTSLFLLANMLFLFINHGPAGHPFLSVPRYVAALFPLYLILGISSSRLPVRVRWALVVVSVLLLGLLTAWFATGRWVA